MSKNKLRTPSYFIKRLKDNGFVVLKVFNVYAKSDPRQWTIIVNPTEASVFITCYFNKSNINEVLFEMNDGGRRIQKNFYIATDSIEVIINFLLKSGVSNNVDYPGRIRYLRQRINKYDEQKQSS